MAQLKAILTGITLAAAFDGVLAQSTTTAAACSTIAPANGQPSVAAGWSAQVIASDLRTPRGIIFDEEDNLLVVERGTGIVRYELIEDEGCVSTGEAETVVEDNNVRYLHDPDKGHDYYLRMLIKDY